jgi:hypothetical protein
MFHSDYLCSYQTSIPQKTEKLPPWQFPQTNQTLPCPQPNELHLYVCCELFKQACHVLPWSIGGPHPPVTTKFASYSPGCSLSSQVQPVWSCIACSVLSPGHECIWLIKCCWFHLFSIGCHMFGHFVLFTVEYPSLINKVNNRWSEGRDRCDCRPTIASVKLTLLI